jgi:hypothetical protein
MKLSAEQLERLMLHNAFAVHLIAKWMAGRTDVDPAIRDRLATHLEAIDGVLVHTGHDWIREEIEATESALHS